jgi:hemoglobin
MKKDIESRADIELLVDTFYTQVKQDDVIGHYFNDVVKLSWETHIPIMYNFWETVLLNTAGYKGNVMQAHINLDKRTPMQDEHYDRWLLLWISTVNQLFEGNKASEAIARAQTMAFLINSKVLKSREEGFIQ